MSPRPMTDGTVAPAYNDAEKGLIDPHAMRQSEVPLVIPPLLSFPQDEKNQEEKKMEFASPPFPLSQEKVALAAAAPPKIAKPVAKPKKKVSKWILWKLWFNTYRFVVYVVPSKHMIQKHSRKFFTFIITVNCTGIGLAAAGLWPYAVTYSGAMVLGNLFCAILMRNELFGRLLYWFVNTFFAKVLSPVGCEFPFA